MPASRRKFLVVVDDTPECRVALRFAARRAEHTGGTVTALHIIEPPDVQQWRGVEEIMREEALAKAEEVLSGAARIVHEMNGLVPELVVREGKTKDALWSLMAEDRNISILVLASGTGNEGVGPLVSMVAGQGQNLYPIPVTVVPGSLSDAQIDEIA